MKQISELNYCKAIPFKLVFVACPNPTYDKLTEKSRSAV